MEPPVAPWGPQGAHGPLGRPMDGRPMGPLGPWAPWAASGRAPRGTLGPPWAPWAPWAIHQPSISHPSSKPSIIHPLTSINHPSWRPVGPLGPLAPWAASHGRHLGPLGPWAPWVALAGRPVGPKGPHGGAQGAPGAPNPLLWVADKFETLPENRLLGIFGSKIGEKVGIQAPGPPRRDLGRNSVLDPGFKIPHGGVAIHLVAKRCDLGSLGVPGPASTPLGPGPGPMGPGVTTRR